MNAAKLKLHAELLEREIQANLSSNKDVDWLAQYSPLLEALRDAKEGKIDQPRDLGLARWELESSIQDLDVLSERLAQFGLLLWGWDRLPSENGS